MSDRDDSTRVPPNHFPSEIPEVSRAVRPLYPVEDQRTLAQQLVPTADTIRQLYTRFGLRPYRVYLVHAAWSGQVKGQGELRVLRRIEILPTPKVESLDSTSFFLKETGRTETGQIIVTQVSPKYAEDDLLGRVPAVQDPDNPRTSLRNREFYWEVQEGREAAPKAVRRRYVPTAAPDQNRGDFCWTVTLRRQDYATGRNGGTARRSFL